MSYEIEKNVEFYKKEDLCLTLRRVTNIIVEHTFFRAHICVGGCADIR